MTYLHGDNSEKLVKQQVESVKRSVGLDADSVNKVSDYSGHRSADYGEGGPSAAGPSSKAPGTGS